RSRDVNAIRYEHVMRAVEEVLYLQRKTIELQVQTIKMIDGLSQQMESGFKYIDQQMIQLTEMERRQWVTSHYRDVYDPLNGCSSVENNIKLQMVEASVPTSTDLTSLYAEMSDGQRIIDKMVSLNTPFPVINASMIKTIGETTGAWSVRPDDCFG